MEITTRDGKTIIISDEAILGVITVLEQFAAWKAAKKANSVVKVQNPNNSVSQTKEAVTR